MPGHVHIPITFLSAPSAASTLLARVAGCCGYPDRRLAAVSNATVTGTGYGPTGLSRDVAAPPHCSP